MIETERLILRRWEDRDRPAFHGCCSDPEVMRYLGGLWSREEVDAAIDRQNGFIDSVGYAFWALERRADGAFLGFCGIKPGADGTPLENGIEIGWRLGRAHWGRGYAREAAQASLDWGWANLDVTEIAAMTVPANTASWGLMERLGMVRDHAADFEHPALAVGDPLRPHIVYRIARPG